MKNEIKYVNLGIVGSRTYTDYNKFLEVVHTIVDRYGIVPKEIVSGGAKGGDKYAEEYAREFEIALKVFPAKWVDENGFYDNAAGMKRNVFIIQYSDFIIAIWDGESKGTKNSINIAKNLNKPIIVYNYIEDKYYEFNIKEKDILEN
jgi:uncharacterized phage-like protein YoqJ